jgi:hypothetical protein
MNASQNVTAINIVGTSRPSGGFGHNINQNYTEAGMGGRLRP